MAEFHHILELLDLDPVIVSVFLAGLLLRIASAASLRSKRRILRRMTTPAEQGFRDSLNEWLDVGLLFTATVFLVVRPLCMQSAGVASTSMLPTLEPADAVAATSGDRILINKYLLRFRPPQRGEVIVFRMWAEQGSGEGPERVVKRLIASAGDRVAINANGQVVLNGVEQDEHYIAAPSSRTFSEQVVPDGTVFVLGDNRNNSFDSSTWQPSPFLDTSDIEGKAVAIVWPPSRIRLLDAQRR